MSKIKFLHTDCDPSLAQDKSLPCTAYLVEYTLDGLTKFDIVISSKRVYIFDHYWDNYRSDFISMNQTAGVVNPRLWVDKTKEKKSK